MGFVARLHSTGFEKPSAIQQKGIVPFTKGLDVIQQAQSGTGKTATFCAGILNNLDYGLQECQGLVLAPTRELAQQIEKVMRALGDYLQVGCMERSFLNLCPCASPCVPLAVHRGISSGRCAHGLSTAAWADVCVLAACTISVSGIWVPWGAGWGMQGHLRHADRPGICHAQQGVEPSVLTSVLSMHMFKLVISTCMELMPTHNFSPPKTCDPQFQCDPGDLLPCLTDAVHMHADASQVKCHACVGGTSVREDARILGAGVHVVVGTPGRVFDMLRRRCLRADSIKMFVLDEADEMLSRGFKDQIYDIFQLLPPKLQVRTDWESLAASDILRSPMLHANFGSVGAAWALQIVGLCGWE